MLLFTYHMRRLCSLGIGEYRIFPSICKKTDAMNVCLFCFSYYAISFALSPSGTGQKTAFLYVQVISPLRRRQLPSAVQPSCRHLPCLAPSLTGLGAVSTSSFASFRPRPVISLTTLITLIFSAPAAFRITSNSVFSSAAGAAPPAAGAAATATGAAALTPNFSSRSLTSSASSSTFICSIASKICCLIHG